MKDHCLGYPRPIHVITYLLGFVAKENSIMQYLNLQHNRTGLANKIASRIFAGLTIFLEMAYAVVEFQHKFTDNGEEQVNKEVDIVASKWIHDDGKLCWWPGKNFTSTMAEKMAKNLTEVSDKAEWEAYEIQVLYRHGEYYILSFSSIVLMNIIVSSVLLNI